MTDMLLYQILAYTICRTKVRTSYKNKIFKVSVRMWNEKFQLSDGSYYLSDIQDCSATDAIRIISKIAIQKQQTKLVIQLVIKVLINLKRSEELH